MRHFVWFIILVVIIVGSAMNWVITPHTDLSAISVVYQHNITVFPADKLTVKPQLEFSDGIRNGVRMCGTFFGGPFLLAYSYYMSHFPDDQLWKIGWGIVGIPMSLFIGVLQMYLGVFPALVKRILLISVNWPYYIGFALAGISFIALLAGYRGNSPQTRSKGRHAR